MSEISVGAQVFDVIFHPTRSILYSGLLTGQVKAFSLDERGQSEPAFTVQPSKRSCRSLSIDEDGMHLYAVGKGKSLNTIDTNTTQVETRKKAHESSINRVKCLTPWLLSTGDDEGVIKLWDPRNRDCIRTYKQHFDYITDFLWLEDKKHLVATSGDGTLSVVDIRSQKSTPIAHSEDQEDELLSIVAIKSATKIVVGTQIGILSIFNRSSGWGDCVDRIPGHPQSIDALCSLPPSFPASDTTILTGSSDGYVRAVQLFPTKLLGVIADHGEMPVERIAIGGGIGPTIHDPDDSDSGEDDDGTGKKVGPARVSPSTEEDEDQDEESIDSGRWWVASVGHEDVLHITNLLSALRTKEGGESTQAGELDEGMGNSDGDTSDDESDNSDSPPQANTSELKDSTEAIGTVEGTANSDSDSDAPKPRKRKRKPEQDLLAVKKKRGKNQVEIEGGFFDEL
ncbi:WD40 repeat-like protein [Pluteus cervinus]|uniref:WD40 repeat-like protein n=1 Tax=Pluteus cervinus TaxID=181527 RepID=A0ACD3BBY7_9AGAR|nr:WD40 repeat-like protein [Pluteus cervinus]